MDGREFLQVARDVVTGGTEAHWRTAAGLSYYALMLTLRDAFVHWGLSAPPRASVHQSVYRRVFTSADTDMKQIGRWLARLRDLRSFGDYELTGRPEFATIAEALRCIRLATDALALLDVIQADTPRRDTIVAEIRSVFP
jgi:hypothetical protein